MERRHNVQPQLYRGEIDGARRRETNAILGIYKSTHSPSLSLLHQLFLVKESFQKSEKTNMVRWDHLTKIWSQVRKRKKDNQKSLVRLAGAVAGISRRGLNNWRRRGRSWQNGNRRTNCPDLDLWNLVGIKGVFQTKLGIKIMIKLRSATLGFEGKTQWSFKSVQEISIISLL